MMICIYCGKGLVQPIVKNNSKDYHLHCYIEKDGSKIFKPILDYLIRRLEFMGEICENVLDNKSTIEERQKKLEEIRSKNGS